jgi:hypothetical protein
MFSRVILPLLLFVAMVAGIAWVTQYVPWRGSSRTSAREKVEPPPCVKFDNEDASRQVRTFWDVKDSPYLRGTLWLKAVQGELTEAERLALVRLIPESKKEGEKKPAEMTRDELKVLAEPGLSQYVKESETMVSGFADFPFVNLLADLEVEVGVKFQSCACSSVEIGVLSAQQYEAFKKAKAENSEAPVAGVELQPVPENERQGVVISPASHGLVRVRWKPREQKQDRIVLSIHIWANPRGEPQARGKIANLQTALRFVPPVQADVPEHKVRPIEAKGSSTVTFWCWTSTRPEAKTLRVVPEKDEANFTFRVTRADEKQRVDLQNRLWVEQHSLVAGAWRVEATVYEDRQGKQMDMGAFARRLSLYLDDEKESQAGPLVKGTVISNVAVGTGTGAKEGKIELGAFDASKDFSHTVKLRTDPGVVLKYQESDLSFLNVSLSLNKKESTKYKLVWDLRVHIPKRGEDNEFTGQLPDNSAIVLIRESADGPPRRVRILVEGTASPR